MLLDPQKEFLDVLKLESVKVCLDIAESAVGAPTSISKTSLYILEVSVGLLFDVECVILLFRGEGEFHLISLLLEPCVDAITL